MTRDPDWEADLRRWDVPNPLRREQSLWAIRLYRFGRRVDRRPPAFSKRLLTKLYWLLVRVVETATGISLPKEAAIGPGLKIWHFGGIFINPGVTIGAGCTLRQGVTIGNRHDEGPVPVIGDNVEFGAYAQVLGGVRIGDNCRIGALSVVLTDVPAGMTAIGIPARIVSSSALPETGKSKPVVTSNP